jgi:polyhydroxybutyrate depolymerase
MASVRPRTITLAALALLSIGWLLTSTPGPTALAATTGAAAGSAEPCQSAPARTGSSTVSLTSGGLTRTAVLHLPPMSSTHPLPLLIALHGWGGTGARFERDTGFSTIADRDGFAVVYPSSHGTEWVINGSDRDVDFISQLIDRVARSACIDPRRIYATGVSNGGRMAARLGCELSRSIAAIAPVAGGYSNFPACRPVRPVSVLEIHGTADTTVPYEGKGPEHAGAVLPYVFAWASRDGCATQPSKSNVAAHTVRYSWTGCSGGSKVQQLRIYGGGHGFPEAAGAEIDSSGPQTISAAEQVWRFFAPITLSPEAAGSDQDAPPSSWARFLD